MSLTALSKKKESHRFSGGCIVSTSELFLFCLFAPDDRDGQEVFVDLAIEVEDDQDLLLGLVEGRESRVTLLPQELTGPEERLGVLELPPETENM